MATKFEKMTLDVFGRKVMILKSATGWQIFYMGDDGKRRPAHDIMVPNFVTESELIDFIYDLCHEWATEKHPRVRRIE